MAPCSAAVLLAIDPDCIFYAQEARPYAIAQLFALAACWGHLCAAEQQRLGRTGGRARMLAVVFSAIVVHLHLTGALIVAALLAARLVVVGVSWRTVRQAIEDTLGILVLAAPLAWLAWGVAAHRDDWRAFVPAPQWSSLWTTTPLLATVVAPAVLLIVAGSLARWRRRFPSASFAPATKAPRETGGSPAMGAMPLGLILIACLGGTLVALLAAKAEIALVFYRRYLILFWPLWMAAAALLLQRLPTGRWRMVGAIFVLACFLNNNHAISRWRLDGRLTMARSEDWRAAVLWLNARRGPAEPLWLRSDYLEADLLPALPRDDLLRGYCLAPISTLYRPLGDPRHWTPLPTTDSWKYAPRGDPEKSQQIWFMLHAGDATRRRFVEELTRRGIDVDQTRVFGNVTVLGART